MTVYVDGYRVPAQLGRIFACWSHMFVAPDGDLAVDELHALAARIGLRRSWFQDKEWPAPMLCPPRRHRRQACRGGRREEGIRGGRPIQPQQLAARRFPVLTVHNPVCLGAAV